MATINETWEHSLFDEFGSAILIWSTEGSDFEPTPDQIEAVNKYLDQKHTEIELDIAEILGLNKC